MKGFLKKNKKKIIVGGMIVGGIILTTIGLTTGKKELRAFIFKEGFVDATDFNFGFNNLEEALSKFKELSADAPNGTIALWNKGMEGFEYLVQDLS